MSKIRSFVYPYLQRIRYVKFISLFERAKRYPMGERKILMFSTSKGALGGNLLAVKHYIAKNHLPFEVEVITSLNRPDNKTLARKMAQSKFILVDDYEPIVYPLKLREGQHLVQVWHAMGAFKRFGYARKSAEKCSLTHKNYTEAIVSSPELREIYAESFGIDEERVKPVGTPRTDLFFDEMYIRSVQQKWYSKYPVLKGKKVCLFAPTFRGENVNDAYYPERFLDIVKLYEELGREWVLMIKLHPFVKHKPAIPDYLEKYVIDVSDEREINDILFITDVLVTDYSSVIFENAVIGNAAVMYAPDLEEYNSSRGFYFDYNDYACGDIITEQHELAAAVKRASADDARMKQFRERFVSLCDGNSSQRFVETILEDK